MNKFLIYQLPIIAIATFVIAFSFFTIFGIKEVFGQEATPSSILLETELKDAISDYIYLTWIFMGIVVMYIGVRLGVLLFD